MCVCAYGCTCAYMHTLLLRSVVSSPFNLLKKSKLGRNWQRVGAACQASQTREVVKHKHFGVYPWDLYSLATGGWTCVEGGLVSPGLSPAPLQPRFHSWQRASERAARGCPSLPSHSTGRAGWVSGDGSRTGLLSPSPALK